MVGMSSCEGVFGLAVEGWEGDWAAVCALQMEGSKPRACLQDWPTFSALGGS